MKRRLSSLAVKIWRLLCDYPSKALHRIDPGGSVPKVVSKIKEMIGTSGDL